MAIDSLAFRTPKTVHRGRENRTALYCTDRLLVTGLGRTFPATPITFSTRGIGITFAEEFKPRAIVWLAGPIDLNGSSMALSGQAQIGHCSRHDSGPFVDCEKRACRSTPSSTPSAAALLLVVG